MDLKSRINHKSSYHFKAFVNKQNSKGECNSYCFHY